MISISEIFDHFDRHYEKMPGGKNADPEDEAEKKYMAAQGMIVPV